MVVRNVPAGLGSPVFDKLEANLARALLSIPACKGFEVSVCKSVLSLIFCANWKYVRFLA